MAELDGTALGLLLLLFLNLLSSTTGDNGGGTMYYGKYRGMRHLPNAAVANQTKGLVWRDYGISDTAYTYVDSDGLPQPIDLQHLATFLALTDDIDDLPDTHGEAFAALLAMEHFNTRSDVFVPQLAYVDDTCPSLRFTMEFFDTEQSPIVAANYVINDLNKRPTNDPDRPVPTAIIGPDTSLVAAPVALMSNLAGRPVFSHSATSTDLNREEDYPLFGRVVPSLRRDASTAVDFMKRTWNVTHFAIIAVRDNFGLSYAQELQNAAARSDVETCSVSLGDASDVRNPASLKSSIDRLKKLCGDFRYIFGIFGKGLYEPILSAANKHGLMGVEWVWLFSDLVQGLQPRLPIDHELVDLVAGNSVVSIPPPLPMIRMTPKDEVQAARMRKGEEFLRTIGDLLVNEEWVTYVRDMIGSEELSAITIDDNGLPNISPYSILMYDQVISVALATCAISNMGPKKWLEPGPALHKSFMKTTFMGASGNVTIDPRTGNRLYQTMTYAIQNVYRKGQNQGSPTHAKYGLNPTDIFLSGSWENIDTYYFVNGTTTVPDSLSPFEANVTTASTSGSRFGLALCVMQMIVSLGFGIWTFVHRKNRIIVAAQPLFLGLICGGSALMAAAIIPLNTSSLFGVENKLAADISCQLVPWFFCFGFTLSFSSLISKMSRVNKLFNTASHRRIQVTVRDVLRPMVVLLSVTVAILVAWTVVAPLSYELVPSPGVDQYGRTLTYMGTCTATTDDWKETFFVLLILCVFAVSLIYANIECWRARHISTEYSEGKYISMSMVILLQGLLIGIPLLVVCYDNPTAYQLIGSILLVLISGAVLLPIYISKVIFYRQWVAKQAVIAKEKEQRIQRQKEFQERLRQEKEREDEESAAPGLAINCSEDDDNGHENGGLNGGSIREAAPQSFRKAPSIVGTFMPLQTTAILLLVAPVCIDGFAPVTPRMPPLRAHRSTDPALLNNADDNQEPNRNHMDYLRSLQDIFYSESSDGSASFDAPSLDKKTGIMKNLPMYYAPSTELPGRSTVLFIDDPMDTNMFEALLRSSSSDSPYCHFGQLFADPNQTRDILKRSKLKGWEAQAKGDASATNQSAFIGTLMRIMDVRRVNDGRMVLLIQGIERFVVVQACQQLPYPVANVQILPDEEDLNANDGTSTCSRVLSLANAIHSSFEWHPYEYYDRVRFAEQTSPDHDVAIEDIVGEGLSELIPFVPFSDYVNPHDIALSGTGGPEATSDEDDNNSSTLLEDLVSYEILQHVPTYSHALAMLEPGTTADDFEYDVWVCIDEYVRLRKLEDIISPDLLSLLPQGIDWPDGFVLDDIASGSASVRVGASYPDQRRQKRLSYSATGLLGGSTPTELLHKGVRQTLLEIPSTHGRLWAVLERYVEYNSRLRAKNAA